MIGTEQLAICHSFLSPLDPHALAAWHSAALVAYPELRRTSATPQSLRPARTLQTLLPQLPLSFHHG